MDSINIIPVSIEEEMKGSYLDYAMSVIIGRAIPDARDGLKPVHRRILYAMLGEGLTSGKKFSKCAGVVGEVLKRLHPHGDSAVYDALVRLAQPWSMRYPLIDGQGNFGSIDGDSPAAYRYTECRMQAIAESLLADIDKETVDFSPNFDDSNIEPDVLPSRIPNLLINGAEGIAVGMASKIPPHNLREVITATIKLIKEPETEIEELMQIVPGPDFPTAGIIYGSAPLQSVYKTGRGVIKIRAKLREETIKAKSREVQAIIVDEIPYQVNKARLIERIAELVNEKKIEGISRLRDESDRRGMRIVIELKRDAVSEVVQNQLFSLTPLQRSFGVNMLAIVDGQPRVMNLKEVLSVFIRHRREVITRRTRFELSKARARLHILEGLKIALDNIDEVIALIKASESTAEAKKALIEKFSLSEIQAQHILDMPLRRLTGLERKAIEDEYQELLLTIERLTEILTNPAVLDSLAISELEEVSNKFGDERRTQIEENGEEIDLEDLIAEEQMVVSVSHKGYIKRTSTSTYRAQGRGGKGVQGTKKLGEDEDDFISELFVASTHAYLLVFTNKGQLHWIKVYQAPEAGRTARGRAIVNMLGLSEGEKVSAILPVRDFNQEASVILCTKEGYAKRVDLKDFSNVRKGGIRAITLENEDTLIGVRLLVADQNCIISTKEGMSIRFGAEDIRVMGRTARGVRAIKLSKGDEVVNVVSPSREEEQPEDKATILTVCEKGYGKRTLVDEYRLQSRGGKGVIDIKTTERNGGVIGTSIIHNNDDVMIITTGGKIIRLQASAVSVIGRNTQGVRLINLDEGEKVAAIARVAEEDKEEGE